MSDLWKELHLRALNFEGTDDMEYLIQFSKRIPKFTPGCKCREFWLLWVRSNRPTFNKYFEWTVTAHNAVNKKTRKREITLEEAKKLYLQDNYSKTPEHINLTN